jgi:glycosyltransferase involved in cell wall biosynthesis
MESTYHRALGDSSTAPLVSVILPVFNRAGWIGLAVESVLSQTYQNLELLVIDDGSTDATGEVLERFGSRIKVLKKAHAGAEAARNLGLEHARGEFIGFIDSDDVWYPNRLSLQLPLFSKPEVGLVFGNAVLVDHRSKPPRALRRTFFDNVRPSRGQVMKEFARGCFVPCSSVLVRRHCFAELGGFTVGYVAADYLKWLQISARYELDYVAEPVFEYAIHPDGLSHNLVATLEDRLLAFRQALEQNNPPEMDRVMRRIVFNVEASLRLARLRQRLRSSAMTTAPRSPALPISPGEKLNWSLKFVGNVLRTRGRWWMTKYGAALSGRRVR